MPINVLCEAAALVVEWTITENHKIRIDPDDVEHLLDDDGTFSEDALFALIADKEGEETYEATEERKIDEITPIELRLSY